MYDIADLYKAEVTIPIAFEVAAQAPEDLPAVVRFSRTRGGDPITLEGWKKVKAFSPHTRG